MPPEVQEVFKEWSPPLTVNLALVLSAFFYWRGWRHLNRAFPNIFSTTKLALFLSGLFALWIAIGSPLEAFDDELLSIHMVQHMLLMLVAPPLLLLGAPALPILHGLPKSFVRRVLGPIFRWRPAQVLGHFLTHPVFCWLSATLASILWHLPRAFEFALRSDAWHEVEHICFFTSSLLFWWPVIQPWPSVARWPRWSIPVYLFVGVIANDILSAFLAFWDTPIYPSYASADHRLFNNITPLDDQAFAGALMWVFGTFVYIAPAVVITMQVLSPVRRTQRVPATEKA